MNLARKYGPLLGRAGLKPTANRLAVLAAVEKSPAPLTAGQVGEAVRKDKPINRVTVYRILELLVEAGLVQRLSAGDRRFRYGRAVDRTHVDHPHFYCRGCGRLECLPAKEFGLDLAGLARHPTRKVERIEIRLDGICENCLKKLGG